ncbi:hypothetical protein [Hyphomonas sp.]|uniref:hypothetical protein n=1 Tax=Hyphomonas sp. TaxID=87 RepID=UPI0025BCDF59|nr:hypothetical protein [Hyphomonas sp.]
MAITQAMCTSFKKELLEGKHDFSSAGHTFKIALFSAAATLSAGTTNFTTSGEVVGSGYTTGGETITQSEPTTDGTTGFVDFNNVTFTGVTLTARGAVIYNSTTEGSSSTTNAVCVLDFSADQTANAGNFTISFPSADGTNAIVRIE